MHGIQIDGEFANDLFISRLEPSRSRPPFVPNQNDPSFWAKNSPKFWPSFDRIKPVKGLANNDKIGALIRQTSLFGGAVDACESRMPPQGILSGESHGMIRFNGYHRVAVTQKKFA